VRFAVICGLFSLAAYDLANPPTPCHFSHG
jgi:hypothetical protein